ncbi:protein-glutamate O-methyltransferase CheR [Halobacteriovorax sp. XZX-3]|uniref:CheR family methyltransferase n=2 Tax=Halobacteriovorax TaxID=1652133 RepID=UPI00371A0BC6
MIYLMELNSNQMEKIIDLVHFHTGITISPSKKSMLQGRIRQRLKALELESYDDYIAYLQTDINEKQEFINIITTNETTFFRTEKVWKYFQEEFLINWKNSLPVKIWSAASSTGEEAYSIAMSCEEHKKIKSSFQYEIVGTDISTKVLKYAQDARYSGRNITNFKERHTKLFQTYFNEDDDFAEVVPELRKNTSFSSHNLFSIPKGNIAQFDIVFLRNVLIYFKQEDQKQVINNISRAMKPGAILILGESESLNGLSSEFEYVHPQTYKKK